MAEKSPDEVPEDARQEMSEIIVRIRGATVRNLLWETGLTDSERRWMEDHVDEDELNRLDAIGIWMRLRGVSDARAALDVALKCDLLTAQKHTWLSREIGAEGEDIPVSVRDAIASAQLVLIENPPSVHWCGKEIDCDWEQQRVVWEYFRIVARAAKLGRAISYRDFDSRSSDRSLADWKHRLLKNDDLFGSLGPLIESRQGEHRLNLPPNQIRFFHLVAGNEVREVNY